LREDNVKIHNYTPELIENYCRFLNIARSDRPDREEIRVEDLRSYFAPPHYDSKGHFLALMAEEIVADILGTRNLGYAVLPPDRINLTLNVLPQYRKKGIGGRLVDIAMNYFGPRGAKIAVVDDIHAKCSGSISFYKKKGFRESTRSYWMECKLVDNNKLPYSLLIPNGYKIRSLDSREELEPFMNAINEAFSDTPDFVPLTKERFEERYVNTPFFNLEGFVVAVEEGAGNIIGTSANLIDIDRTRGDTFGHIKGVGVKKAHRERGLGKLLMIQSLNWLSSRKIGFARLGTQSPKAIKMYRLLGFEIVHEYIRFEKTL
jgi:mycothiol synthase